MKKSKFDINTIMQLCFKQTYKVKQSRPGVRLENLELLINKIYSINNVEDYVDFVISNLKIQKSRFKTKFLYWLDCNNKGLWCISCGTAPPRKGNHFFCAECYRKARTKSEIIVGESGVITPCVGSYRTRIK